MLLLRTSAKQKVERVFWLLLYVASFSLSVLGCCIENWLLFAIFKSLFMPTVAVLAYSEWQRPLSRHYYVLQMAFLFAWLGDVLLAFASVHWMFFVLGASSFLVQHAFYIWNNLSAWGKSTHFFPYWGLPHVPYLLLFSMEYFSCVDHTLKMECMIYSLFLGTAFMTAFYRDTPNRRNYWTMVTGFAFFVVSDMLIAVDKFIYPLTAAEGSLILVTYYIAQTLICYASMPDSFTTSLG